MAGPSLRDDIFPPLGEPVIPQFAAPRLTANQLDAIDAASMGSLRRGYESGRLGTEANYNLARESSLRAAGDVAAADALSQQTQALKQRASIYAPQVQQLEQITGIGDVPGYVAGQIGSGAASMQDPVMAAGALTAVGTGLSLVPHPGTRAAGAGIRNLLAPAAAYALGQRQLTGEQYGRLKEDPTVVERFTPQEINEQANTYGAGAALLDTVVPGMVGRQLGGAALLAKGAKPLLPGGLRVAGGLVGEGATEAAQAAGGQFMHGQLNPLRDTSQDLSELTNSFVGGAVGAGGPVLAGQAVDSGLRGLRAVPGAVKDAAGTVVDMAKGAAEKVPGADTAVDAVKGAVGKVVDLKDHLRAASAEKADVDGDEARLMSGFVPPEVANDPDPNVFAAWDKEHAPKRMDLLAKRLTERAQAGDERAQELLAGLASRDPADQLMNMDLAAEHILGSQALEELSQEAEKSLGSRVAARGGEIAGRVMDGVLQAGKAAVEGFSNRKRKLNAQEPAWTGDEYESRKHAALQAFDDAKGVQDAKERSYQRAQLMGEILASRAKAEMPRYSAHRVKLPSAIPTLMQEIGEEIASLAESWRPSSNEGYARPRQGPTDNQPGTATYGLKDAPSYGPVDRRRERAEAQSGATGPWSPIGKDSDKRTLKRFDAMTFDLDRIARSLKAAYEDPETVLQDLRKTADPSAAPFFDYLGELMQAKPEQRAQTRQEARDAVVASIDEQVRTRLLQEGIDLQKPAAAEQLLRMVDDVSRGRATPAARRALTDTLGKNNLESALDVLYRHTPESLAIEEAYARQTETSTTDSGLDLDENGDVVDATEITDFDKRQVEKAVNKRPAARLYGFFGTPKPRGAEVDPLEYDNEKVTKAAIKKWNEQARAMRELGQEPDYSTDPRQNDARRPRLFNLAQQGEAIEKRKLALEKQLKVDQTPEHMLEILRQEQAALRKKTDEESKIDLEARTKAIRKVEMAMAEADNTAAKDWLAETTRAFFVNRAGSWNTEVKSAWDVMTEHDGIEKGATPNPMFMNKMMARYRDYMRQEVARYKESDPARAKSAAEAMDLANRVLLDRVDQSKGVKPTRTKPKQRIQTWNDTQEYFKSHGMIVAERPPTEDAQIITADRVLKMAETGKKAAATTRKRDEHGNLIPPPDVLVFRSTLADSKTSKPGDLYITTRELMQFARDARFSIEGADFESTSERFSNQSKDQQFLRDLMDGITALVDSGLVEGLPRIHGENGRPQYFTKGTIPESLPLVTKTYKGFKYALEQRAKQPNRKDTTTGPESLKYQEKVAREQNRGFTTPTTEAPEDPTMRARIVLPKEGQFNADLFDRTRDKTKISRTTTLETRLAEAVEGLDPLAEREHDREARVAQRERGITPTDTMRPGEDEAFADQRRRSIIEGRTTEGGATTAKSFPKMKMADLGPKHGETLRKEFEAGFDEGVAEAKLWLRQAAAPAYDPKGLTGGAHLAAPVVYALNGATSGQLGTTPAEKQTVRALRIEAARIIAASDLKAADKVRLARELARPNGRDRIVAANVQKFLQKVAAEGPPLDLGGGRTEKLSRTQNDAVSDEAVREYNEDTGSDYGSAADRTAPDKSLGAWNKERYFEQRSPAPSKDRAAVEQAHAAAALKEGAAPVGKTSERPSGAAGRKLNAQAVQLHREIGRPGFAATHDSPLRHEGRFNWRGHRGKGEGNAAFGAGTYLSTGDGVHRYYKKMFTGGRVSDTLRAALDDMRKEAPSASAADMREAVEEYLRDGLSEVDGEDNARIYDALRELKKVPDDQLLGVPSPTYQVSVDIPPERLLDWDKPLSEQGPTVRLRAMKAIKDKGLVKYLETNDGHPPPPGEEVTQPLGLDITGEDLYHALANKLGLDADEAASSFKEMADIDGQALASDYLQSLGILGHFYAASNGRDGKTPNYVIYDDSKIHTNFVAFSQQNPSNKVSTQAEMDEARNYVAKVLPDIKVMFKQLTGYSGEFIEAQNLIEISTTPGPGTMQVAYHEALHAFFAKFVRGNPQALEAFKALTDDKKIMERVVALLHDHPAAIAQLTDGEERLAYIYQFWAAGLLDLPVKKAGILEAIKRFFHRVLGMVTDSERATAILEAFHAGKMSEPSVAGQVIAKALGEGTLTTKALRKFDRVMAKAQEIALPTQMVLARSESKTARELAPVFWTNPGDEEHGDKGEGYINAKLAEARKYKNLLDKEIQGLSDRDLKEIADLLQKGKATDLASIPYAPHRDAVKGIDALLKRFYRYMTEERGLQLGKINEGYFPRVWDVGTMLEKQEEFIGMLKAKYQHILADGARSSKLSEDEVARRIFEKIISSSLGEHVLPERNDGVLSPFFASGMMRELKWLDAKDSAPYQSKDLIGTLTNYFHSGARAAEYSHRFGQDGRLLAEKLVDIEKELREAGAAKFKKGEFKTAEEGKAWAERRMQQVHKAVGAIEGTLGSDIGSAWRNTSAWITVYQNLRLLPLTLFASVVDPLGMVARGATMRQAYDSFLRGMREVFANWGDMLRKEPKQRQADQWEQLALAVGTVDAAIFSHHVADEYSSMYMAKKISRVNETFFRLNGMESWNKGMRVGATQAAVNFIERHSKLPEAHSARWLKELGLTPADLTFDAEGRLVTDKNVLALQKSISKPAAEQEMVKVHQAIRRWVEGAVLTPNAAQRPTWASDPHYSMFFHLKQFSYSFHQTILKRAVSEMNHGNMAPIGSFLWYIPVMMASDITKGLLQGGGELPTHMKGWDLGDHVWNSVQRAGVLSVGTIGIDAQQDVFSLAGPAVEQVIDSFGQPIGKTIVDALPGKPLFAEALR